MSLLLKHSELKQQLDNYVEQYETKDFVKDDPVQFIHRFISVDDIEIAGFIASCFAYGKREVFIAKLNHIFDIMNNAPFDYIKSGDFSNIKDCDYRFSQNVDLVQILKILNGLYSDKESLRTLFENGYNKTQNIWEMLQYVADYFYSRITLPVTKGFYHLIPNPEKKSALKRLNMMLRWFVRNGSVDIGIWNFIPKSKLLIPLDTHVAQISRKLGLLQRNDNGYLSVVQLTEALKQFDSKDPIKYDFALFGYGVNR